MVGSPEFEKYISLNKCPFKGSEIKIRLAVIREAESIGYMVNSSDDESLPLSRISQYKKSLQREMDKS